MSTIDRRTQPPAAGNSFLPEDYLQKKEEKRAIVISLMLFLFVSILVTAAFLKTYSDWAKVKRDQEEVNKEYVAESKKLEQLKVLEAQIQEQREKADVTLALVERVPRSILLAELINRMPKQLTLTEMNMTSKRIIAPKKVEPKPSGIAGPKTLAQARDAKKDAAKTAKKDEKAPAPKPIAPKFEFKIELTGLSGSDEDVADYYQSLAACPLLDKVDMIFSSNTVVDEVQMRKFKIEATIKATADARKIEPLHIPRSAAASTASKLPKEPADNSTSETPVASTKIPLPTHVDAGE